MGSIYHGWIGNSCYFERDSWEIERFDPNFDKEEEFFQWKVGWFLDFDNKVHNKREEVKTKTIQRLENAANHIIIIPNNLVP